jgi:uncharacterized protein with HEPN domain
VFIEGMDEGGFVADRKTASAVQHQLLLLGEAAKSLSSAFVESYPDIPWREAARTRDRLIHGYKNVDLHTVWRTASVSVPDLLQGLLPFIPSERE